MVVDAVTLIQGAARAGDWRATAWLLERRFPQQFGRATRHELSGPEGQPVEFQTGGLGDLGMLSERQLEDLEQPLAVTHAR